jgi:hypothetical protein
MSPYIERQGDQGRRRGQTHHDDDRNTGQDHSQFGEQRTHDVGYCVDNVYDTSTAVPLGSDNVTEQLPAPAFSGTYSPDSPLADFEPEEQSTVMVMVGVPDQVAVAETSPPLVVTW